MTEACSTKPLVVLNSHVRSPVAHHAGDRRSCGRYKLMFVLLTGSHSDHDDPSTVLPVCLNDCGSDPRDTHANLEIRMCANASCECPSASSDVSQSTVINTKMKGRNTRTEQPKETGARSTTESQDRKQQKNITPHELCLTWKYQTQRQCLMCFPEHRHTSRTSHMNLPVTFYVFNVFLFAKYYKSIPSHKLHMQNLFSQDKLMCSCACVL